MVNKMIDTGFDRYIAVEVEKEGDQPKAYLIKEAKRMLGKETSVKWFDGRPLGYDGWVWVIGITKVIKNTFKTRLT
jgi:hypothetical protein